MQAIYCYTNNYNYDFNAFISLCKKVIKNENAHKQVFWKFQGYQLVELVQIKS